MHRFTSCPPADVVTADPSPTSGPPVGAEGAVRHSAIPSGPSSHAGRETAGGKTSGLTSAGSPCDAFCSSRRSSSWVVVQQGLFGEGTAAPALAGGLAAPAWASAGTRLNKLWENSWTPTEFRQHLEDFFFFPSSFYLHSALAL